MRNKKVLLFIIGFLVLLCNKIFAKPVSNLADHPAGLLIACYEMEEDGACDEDDGPVCGIDASGFPRTFQNQCFADMAYCREGRYYAVVKQGEC